MIALLDITKESGRCGGGGGGGSGGGGNVNKVRFLYILSL